MPKKVKYLFYIRNNNKTYCEVYDESKDEVLSSIFTKEQKTNLKYGENHHGFLFIKETLMTDKTVKNDDCLAFYRKISRKNKK